ncbi:OmpH family outer membrane protein [Planctobacterium marinum]|uniref:Molecular chaperone n=1 Tax=Planctobacterium marinum TaxID=1631968 RepID=A0AA48HZP0_9ALTE|nr:molecular chaperone [Planctobacterium marinum]
MKALKATAVAMTLAASLTSASAYAQQKIGVANVQAIFQSLPQAATIQQTINEEFKDEIQAIKQLESDLQYLMEKQRRDTATMSQQEITELEQELNKLREDYAAKAQPLQQNIQRRQNEERNRILGLIQQGIDKVAQAEEYDVILNAGAVTYIDEQFNVSRQVVEEINKSAAN